MKKITLFALAVLLSYPMVSAKITEIETSCDIWDCYTILEIDTPIDDKLISKEYFVDLQNKEANNIDVSFNMDSRSKDIDQMSLEITDKNRIRISGKIEGGSSNYWGLKAFGDDSFWNSTWWNSSFGIREQFNVTNGLSMARTNVTVVFNFTNATQSDCSDIRISNSTDDGEFTQWNITGTSPCEIRLYDNFTSTETKTYYIYYSNQTPISVPSYLNSNPYEVIWRWNEIDATEFNKIDDESTRNLTKIVDGGKPTLSIYQVATTGGTTLWNITAINPYINYNDIFYFTYQAKWNGSQATNGLPSSLHRMTDKDNFYDFFSYTGNGGGCDYGGFIRNKTSGSYLASLTCSQFRVVSNQWFNVVGYADPVTGYLYSRYYNSTDSFAMDFTVDAVMPGHCVGLRYYGGNPQGAGYIEFIKDFEIGTLLYNRNLTSTLGSPETSLATTTTSTTSTSTTPVNGTQYVDQFCQLSNQLVVNKTIWNGTDYTSTYNITICEYNCSETFLGTKCNYPPTISEFIFIMIFIFTILVLWIANKLLGGL